MTSYVETKLESCNLCQSAHGVHMHSEFSFPAALKFVIVVILLSVTTTAEVFTRTPIITMIIMLPMVTPLVDHNGRAV